MEYKCGDYCSPVYAYFFYLPAALEYQEVERSLAGFSYLTYLLSVRF